MNSLLSIFGGAPRPFGGADSQKPWMLQTPKETLQLSPDGTPVVVNESEEIERLKANNAKLTEALDATFKLLDTLRANTVYGLPMSTHIELFRFIAGDAYKPSSETPLPNESLRNFILQTIREAKASGELQ